MCESPRGRTRSGACGAPRPAIWLISIALASFPIWGQQAPAAPAAESESRDRAEAAGLVREGKLEEANTALEQLLESAPQDPGLLLLRGEVLLALGRSDQALGLLERAAELDPERPRVHFQLATARVGVGDRAGAIEAFGAELGLNSEPEVRRMARLNRSLLYQQQREWAEAAAELEAVLEEAGAPPEIYGDLAVVYLEADRVDDAERTLERARAAGFRSARHEYNVGARRFRDEQFAAAAEAFRRALALDADLPEAERSLAAALDQLGQPEEAARHLRRYLELRPDDPDAAAIRQRVSASGGG